MKKVRATALDVFYIIRDAQLLTAASSLAYTTILSIIPLLAVSFSIFQAFGGMEKLYGTHSPLKLVRDQIELRDGLDRSRKMGPLVKPSGAIQVDTTHRTIPQVVRLMLVHIRKAQKP